MGGPRGGRRPVRFGLVAAMLLGAAPGIASATWSLVAVDPETREVGVAGASCIGGVELIEGLAPGRGAVAAQAMTSLTGRHRAVALLRRGAAPREVIDAISAADADSPLFLPLHRLRQYGVAALGFESEPAAYTGAWTLGWSGHLRGRGVSVQGNVLTGWDVLESALAGFEGAVAACRVTLADRLVAGLAAGAARGGDRRCAPAQSALSAMLVVARPDDDERAPHLRLLVPAQQKGGRNPVTLLRERYAVWRAGHPPDPSACP